MRSLPPKFRAASATPCGLYRSSDGGATWQRLQGNGLPEGVLGRTGVSGTDSNRVYALIEESESCGASLRNVCVAYFFVPILSFRMPNAGDFFGTGLSEILVDGGPATSAALNGPAGVAVDVSSQ